jgi:hypothetical protein
MATTTRKKTSSLTGIKAAVKEQAKEEKAVVAAAPVETTEEAEKHVKKVDAQGRAYATGKRKNAIARVWIKPGSGKIVVNGRPVETYFARPVLRMIVNQPFAVADRTNQFDVGSSQALESREVSPTRCARGRTQKVRPRQSPQTLPVQQTLIWIAFLNIPSGGNESFPRFCFLGYSGEGSIHS